MATRPSKGLPLLLVGLAVLVALVVFISTRNSPNFDEDPAQQQVEPMPTPEPTSS